MMQRTRRTLIRRTIGGIAAISAVIFCIYLYNGLSSDARSGKNCYFMHTGRSVDPALITELEQLARDAGVAATVTASSYGEISRCPKALFYDEGDSYGSSDFQLGFWVPVDDFADQARMHELAARIQSLWPQIERRSPAPNIQLVISFETTAQTCLWDVDQQGCSEVRDR